MKNKKRSRGMQPSMPMAYKEPTPDERVEMAAKHLLREAAEAQMDKSGLHRRLAQQAKALAKKRKG